MEVLISKEKNYLLILLITN